MCETGAMRHCRRLLREGWRRLGRWLLPGLLCLAAAARAGSVEVPAFNTYDMAPFGPSGGLAQDLVDYLNQRLAQGQSLPAYRLRLQPVPRERLVKVHLRDAPGFAGVVLFLAPPFVDDGAMQRFAWSAPLFEDENVLALRSDGAAAARLPLPLLRLEQLSGLRHGAVLGNRYSGLDDMQAAGLLRRDDSMSALAALRKVCLGRVDFAQMSRLMFEAMVLASGCAGHMQLRPLPPPRGQPFARRLLLGRALPPALVAQLQALVLAMPCDTQWQALMAHHAITAPRCGEAR